MTQKFPFPFPLLLLDMIGTVLIAIGLLEYFSTIGLVPEAFRFQFFEFVFIFIGFLCIVPFIFWILAKAKNKST